MTDNRNILANLCYPSRFHREHAPSWTTAVLAALGYAAPELSGGRWCEIGCGQGLGACLLAAANPDMHFTGIDISPAHILAGRQLAQDAGLTNVEFVEMDLANPAGRAGLSSEFDFIVAHGSYSWVEDPVRQAIRTFIGERLAVGGVAYLHYMTHPGSAPFATFHSVFRQMAATHGATSEQSVEAGLKLLSTLKQSNAGFFVAHPAVGNTLEHLSREERAYIAHEYLSGSFAPMHVADVMASMRDVELDYVGSATPIENIDALSIPGSVLPVVQQAKEPALRESLKDIARNQAHRRDLYMRQPAAMSAQNHIEALRLQIFCSLPGAPLEGGLRLDTRIGPVEAPAELVSPVLARLAQAPASFAELETIGNFTARPGLLNQMLQAMMEAGVIHPMRAATSQGESAERLNGVLLGRLRNGLAVPALTAPEIGSALPL